MRKKLLSRHHFVRNGLTRYLDNTIYKLIGTICTCNLLNKYDILVYFIYVIFSDFVFPDAGYVQYVCPDKCKHGILQSDQSPSV